MTAAGSVAGSATSPPGESTGSGPELVCAARRSAVLVSSPATRRTTVSVPAPVGGTTLKSNETCPPPGNGPDGNPDVAASTDAPPASVTSSASMPRLSTCVPPVFEMVAVNVAPKPSTSVGACN